jgi:hypothetical protein
MLEFLKIGFIALYGFILPLLFVKYLIWLIKDYRIARELASNSQRVDAQIVSRRESLTSRPRLFYVCYAFSVDTDSSRTQTLIIEQEVNYKNYSQLNIGSTVEVDFVLNRPKTARLAGDHTDNTHRYSAFMYLSVIGVFWIHSFQAGLDWFNKF